MIKAVAAARITYHDGGGTVEPGQPLMVKAVYRVEGEDFDRIQLITPKGGRVDTVREAVTFLDPISCIHNFIKYSGFTESYYYCRSCDAKAD